MLNNTVSLELQNCHASSILGPDGPHLSLTFRAAEAYSSGSIQAEMFEVEVPAKRRGKPPAVVTEDEEYKNINPEKFKKLATVFQVGDS